MKVVFLLVDASHEARSLAQHSPDIADSLTVRGAYQRSSSSGLSQSSDRLRKVYLSFHVSTKSIFLTPRGRLVTITSA